MAPDFLTAQEIADTVNNCLNSLDDEELKGLHAPWQGWTRNIRTIIRYLRIIAHKRYGI